MADAGFDREQLAAKYLKSITVHWLIYRPTCGCRPTSAGQLSLIFLGGQGGYGPVAIVFAKENVSAFYLGI